MRPTPLILLSTAIALVAPAAAGAATVAVGPVTGPSQDLAQEIRFDAAPGEANRVSFKTTLTNILAPLKVTFTDPGATLTAGTGCVLSADAHSAVCDYRYSGIRDSVRVALGDGDDTLRQAPVDGRLERPVVALGGPGDDTLVGGHANDQLDGGGGTDTLRGGDGSDVLTDGDTDADANADVLDGGDIYDDDGSGFADYSDTVVYADRAQDLTVDLTRTSATNGAKGEGDTLIEMESVVGGAGDDVIRARADTYTNVLRGGAGDDDIRGAEHDDDIEGGAGDDVIDGRGTDRGSEFDEDLKGGAGRDRLIGGPGHTSFFGDAGLDRYRCRSRNDTVVEPQAREVIARACETVSFPALPFSGRPVGAVTGRRLARQVLGCRTDYVATERYGGTVTLRERGGDGRVVGRGRFMCRGGFTTAPRIRLTRRGGRLAHRRHGLLVTVTVKQDGHPDAAWSYRLR